MPPAIPESPRHSDTVQALKPDPVRPARAAGHAFMAGLSTAAGLHHRKSSRNSAYPIYEALAATLRRQDIHVGSMRPTNYYRSLFHVMSGVVALGCIQHVLSPAGLVWVAGSFAAFSWVAEATRRMSPTINHYLMAFFGPMAHAHEHYRVNSATWYATALLLLALFTTPLTASLAVVVLAVGDPVAAMIGRRFGKTKIRANRSLEGSLAFVGSAGLAGLAVLLAYYPEIGLQTAVALALASATAGMFAELYSQWLDDNFTIPVAVGIAASLAAMLIL